MHLPELALTAVAAIFIGMLIGMIGIGGVLLAPWLTHVIGLPVREAIVLSSFAFIGTGLVAFAAATRLRHGRLPMNWPLVLATAPGALLGAWALAFMPGRIALAMLAALTLAVGARALLAVPATTAPDSPAPSPAGPGTGLLGGFASALTGTGGPVVLMPILLSRGTAVPEAVLLGQAAQLPIAITASAGNLHFGGVDVIAGLTIALLLAPGAWLGHWLGPRMAAARLKRLVGVTLVAAGVSFAVKAAGGP